ncbi:uncharacterized protein UBRO_20674 [Ustilago bromivora]|uniref:Uncharacterized protein n=1 Tax=Ustilago bromivora TaxID=307758 RepID=A0A1K0HDU1_9BASI|nr:uncharacterized protein UBRO_20674 [Ustilago bromivora]
MTAWSGGRMTGVTTWMGSRTIGCLQGQEDSQDRGKVWKVAILSRRKGNSAEENDTLLKRRRSSVEEIDTLLRRSRSSVTGDTVQTHIYSHFIIAYKWILIHSTYYLSYSLLVSVSLQLQSFAKTAQAHVLYHCWTSTVGGVSTVVQSSTKGSVPTAVRLTPSVSNNSIAVQIPLTTIEQLSALQTLVLQQMLISYT